MARFCTNCGHPIEGGGAFCGHCGAPLTDAPAAQPQQPQETRRQQTQPSQAQPPQWQQPSGQWSPPRTQAIQTAPQPPQPQRSQWQQPQQPQWQQPAAPQTTRAGAGGSGARIGIPAPGWSDRVNDRELLAALAKQKRVSGRIAAFMVPIPLVGFAVYGLLSDGLDFSRALLYGAIVSLVFLVFSLIGRRQGSAKNAYEGVVVDKQTRVRRRSGGGSDGGRNHSSYHELITVVRTSTGEQKKIVESDDKRTLAWDYLQIGERFRCHPEHAFPYELYDKSHAPYLCCVVCQKKNPVAEDRCKKCGTPLLK